MCDGDKSLVVADELFVSIAERNMHGIVPLYYEMAKAGQMHIDNMKIYDGLQAAYSGGNIGEISNTITKIWNSGEMTQDKLDVIKWLCFENNVVIDYAKTLWAVQRPPHADVAIKAFAKMKPPQFFIYAKDKTQEQVEPRNDSIVNKLFDIIPDKRMRFTAANLGKFDYKVLMRNPIVSIDPRVIEKFKDLDARKNLSLSYGSNEENYAFFRTTVRCELYAINPNVNAVCDMLVAHFFRDKKSKSLNTFWLCYGDIVFQNIRNNIEKDYIQCSCCGKRFWRTSYKNQICEACQPIPVEFDINSMVEKVCSDCGKHFFVKQMARRTHRCEACTAKARKASVARSVEKFRAKL